jgi:hypothetical protein
MKKKSAGIIIIGIVIIAWPLLYLLKIPIMLLHLDHFYPFSILPNIPKPIFILQKVLYIICGIGILRLVRVARILVICISILGILMWIAAILLKTPPVLLNKIIHIVAYAAFCWFFTRPKVKEQFK